jgi:hypothetical protein
MTTIAWDGKTLAADRMGNNGSYTFPVTKIFAHEGLLMGGSGSLDFILQMVEWVKGGRVNADFPKDQRDKDDWQPFLVIEKDRSIVIYERTPYPIRPECRQYAIGSGRDFAAAAMFMGKSASEAVMVAHELNASGTGGAVDILPHVGENVGSLLGAQHALRQQTPSVQEGVRAAESAGGVGRAQSATAGSACLRCEGDRPDGQGHRPQNTAFKGREELAREYAAAYAFAKPLLQPQSGWLGQTQRTEADLISLWVRINPKGLMEPLGDYVVRALKGAEQFTRERESQLKKQRELGDPYNTVGLGGEAGG